MERRAGWVAFTAMVAATVVLGAVAIDNGQLDLFWFLIVPVLRTDGTWGVSAMLMALGAFIMLMVNLRQGIGIEGGQKMSGGGVLFIGPIPIVFGTDRRSTVLVLLITVAVLGTLLFLLLL